MFYNEATNTYIRDGEPFTLNGVQYPANWDRTSLDLVEVTVVGAREDDRYFYVSEEFSGATLTYVNTPKSAEQLKEIHTGELQRQIDVLETSQLMPRVAREFMLASMEASNSAEALALNVGYVKMKDCDTAIGVLRAQIAAL